MYLKIVVLLSVSMPLFANSNHKSPYIDQKDLAVKALTHSDLEGLKKGSGMPFGGMAKAAELNSYPGPRHVLDAAEEIALTAQQKSKILDTYKEMNQEAKLLGMKLIDVERKLDELFANKKVSNDLLRTLVSQSAELYGKLRYVHLVAHLKTKELLTQKQIQTYNSVRGYADDPCKNIPKGHPPEMWRKHHNCK